MDERWNQTLSALHGKYGEAAVSELLDGSSVRIDAAKGLIALSARDEAAATKINRAFHSDLEQTARLIWGRDVRVRVRSGGVDAPAEPTVVEPAPQLSLFDYEPVQEELSLFDLPPVAAPVAEPVAVAQPAAPLVVPAPTGGALDEAAELRLRAAGLSRGLDFAHFVVGSSNQFAWEAARAVTESPGTHYNPFFLFGGVGLGKTHLMQAIGSAITLRNPEARVRYVHAETFLNELISSISGNAMEAFRARYRRDVDVLLLDDIHVLEGKERTTEEFFHTFNSLAQAGKQIVLTSDRSPQELSGLDQRVRSRLMMGLSADITAPDFETRVAILQRRASELHYAMPSEVLQYVADAIRSNVRELHGALTRIGSYARIHRLPITVTMAREQLQRVTREQDRRPTMEIILKLVCEEMGVTAKEVKGRKRVATIATPRKVAVFLCRRHTDESFPALGRFFGDRDHTTILSAHQSVEEMLSLNHPIRTVIERIERRIAAL